MAMYPNTTTGTYTITTNTTTGNSLWGDTADWGYKPVRQLTFEEAVMKMSLTDTEYRHMQTAHQMLLHAQFKMVAIPNSMSYALVPKVDEGL